MSSFQAAVPLPLSGNTTDQQNRLLQESLSEAIQTAYRAAMEQLDHQRAETVIEKDRAVRSEIADRVIEVIQRHAASDKYRDEDVGSQRTYPQTYHVRPVEAQVTELRKLFPSLQVCQEKLARRPLPAGAEDWFAIPRWQALAPTYSQALELVLEKLASRRRISNRIVGRLGEANLRQTSRSKLAMEVLADQQKGSDILVVAAQAGMLHRGTSARRARVVLASNEFAFGSFAFACLLLTHPERLSAGDTLMVDCAGDEYSVQGDNTFARVPLFDYGLGGVEFSIFYEDRARNMWGSPSGFLCKSA